MVNPTSPRVDQTSGVNQSHSRSDEFQSSLRSFQEPVHSSAEYRSPARIPLEEFHYIPPVAYSIPQSTQSQAESERSGQNDQTSQLVDQSFPSVPVDQSASSVDQTASMNVQEAVNSSIADYRPPPRISLEEYHYSPPAAVSVPPQSPQSQWQHGSFGRNDLPTYHDALHFPKPSAPPPDNVRILFISFLIGCIVLTPITSNTTERVLFEMNLPKVLENGHCGEFNA